MKFGADPKKLAMLGVLVSLGGYSIYTNLFSNSSSPRERRSTPAATPAPMVRPGNTTPVRRTATRGRNSEEFRPSLRRRAEDAIDPTTIDPTLRLDLLTKVQAVNVEGGSRNLFQFGAAPPPEAPEQEGPRVVPKTPEQLAKEQEEANKPPTPAGPPPINLKYYGYSNVRGEPRKKAFFLDGEDILVGAEGELVKKRYRVVRIGISSVVMEDTESKHQETLPLQAESADERETNPDLPCC